MTLLRHISGNDLTKLERELEKITKPIVVIGVNHVSNNWFIHFLVQDIAPEGPGVRVEVAQKTKTKVIKA